VSLATRTASVFAWANKDAFPKTKKSSPMEIILFTIPLLVQ